MKSMQKQSGFSLIELIIVLGVIGLVIGGILAYQNQAQTRQKSNESVTALTTLVSSVKSSFGPSGSYAAVTAANLAQAGMVIEPFRTTGTTIEDPWGNLLDVAGDASRFSIRIGPLDQNACISIATGLVRNAVEMNLGAVAALGGAPALTGGEVYKSGPAATPDGNALAVGCGATDPYVGAAFR